MGKKPPKVDWQEVVRAIDPQVRFRPPARPADVDKAERGLRIALPDQLRSFLLQSNGAYDRYGFGLGIVWSAEEVLKQNLYFRRHPDFPDLYMPFDALLFFGDAGNGDQFAFRICGDRAGDVFLWDHENDSRTWCASTLRDYLERLLKGQIEV